MARVSIPSPFGLALLLLAGFTGDPAAAAKVNVAQSSPPAPQIPRDSWKDCAFNGMTIGCRDEQLPDGFRVVWKDGLRMTYSRLPQEGSTDPQRYRDRLGGIWRQELFPQGNKELTNVSNGNRIFIPLRHPCRPPLKGEVGFCHY